MSTHGVLLFIGDVMRRLHDRRASWGPRKAIKTERVGDCLVCISHKPLDTGYFMICVSGKYMKMHRFIYMRKHGSIPKGKVIRHSCDNRACINIDHLLIGTYQDNADDMVRRNRQRKGEDYASAVLTDEKVREIREMKRLNPKLKQKDMAIIFGVNVVIIHGVVNNKTWRHVI